MSGTRRCLLALAGVWPVLLLFAGGELLLALFAGAPVAAGLIAVSHRPFVERVAGGDWLNALVDVSAAMPYRSPEQAAAAGGALGPTPETSAIALAFSLSLATVPLAVVLHGLLYTLASGAALEGMARPPARLWRAGRAWLWPMLRLGLILLPLTVLLGGGASVALALAPGRGLVFQLVKLLALLIWLGGIGNLFELARASMVLASDRSAWGGIGRALRTVASRPLATGALWLALWLGNVVHAVSISALTLLTPATIPSLSWLVTLLAVGTGTAYKLFRLAAQLQFARK